jgi:GNAT superfamily N-acetyltransferase
MIRPAGAADIPAIHQMIVDLATYERSGHEVSATEDDLRAALLAGPAEPGGPDGPPALFAHVAEEDGQAVGFALWFLSYSTWLGRHGIHLEDLYVKPERRGHGHGRALLTELARICVERGYGRLEWSVLDWNTPARRFYESLDAVTVDEWVIYRLTGPALQALARDGR